MSSLKIPNQERGAELSPDQLINTRLLSLLEYDPNPLEPTKEQPYRLGTTLWQRETHSKSGEHVFISYNDHKSSKHELPPQFFIQVYGSNHSRNTPQVIDDIRWTANDEPSRLHHDKLDRIELLLSLFKVADSPNDQA